MSQWSKCRILSYWPWLWFTLYFLMSIRSCKQILAFNFLRIFLLPSWSRCHLYEQDKVIFLYESSDKLKNEKLAEAFENAATKLNKEIKFLWMSLKVNEIAPKFSDLFEAEKTGIYIKSDSSIVKFTPVSTENNLNSLLVKFIKERKRYLHSKIN